MSVAVGIAQKKKNAGHGRRVVTVDEPVDQCRYHHAAHGGGGRQDHLGGLGQVAVDHLALDLQADEQEEQRHQAVVDPQQQRFGNLQRADLDSDGHVEQAAVQVGQRRIVDDQGQDGCSDQQQATGGFELEEAGEQATHGL